MSKHQILSIDAWRDGDGWTWNNWHKRGTVTGDQLDAVKDGDKLNARKFLALLRAEGLDLPTGKVAVENDGHNYVAVQKNTREPLYAVCYGDDISDNITFAGSGTLTVGGVDVGTVTGLTVEPANMTESAPADQAQPMGALHWPAPIPMSADTLRDQLTRGKARIVGSQRARVLRKRGETVRYAYDTKTGKRRFLWCMGGDKGQA